MPGFARPTTETQLREWRGGQVQAERLAAQILFLDGFREIDPQAPLGGGDGGKDILCSKESAHFVGAAYFPTHEKNFSSIRKKFEGDLDSALRHNRQGFVFITSQAVGLKDRSNLESAALKRGKIPIIFHRERIRSLLDAPEGYGVRLEFLGIPMNETEQFAYFASSQNSVAHAIERQEHELRNLERRIDELHRGQNYSAQTIYRVATTLGENVVPPPVSPQEVSLNNCDPNGTINPLSSDITEGLLHYTHRLACKELPVSMSGRYRNRTVWLGKPGSAIEDATYVPPPADQVQSELRRILTAWNEKFPDLQKNGKNEKIEAIAKFHRDLLAVHPYTDGNGRVARTILAQQCRDLIGHIDPDLLDRGELYYDAVRQADRGNYGPLCELIKSAMEM